MSTALGLAIYRGQTVGAIIVGVLLLPIMVFLGAWLVVRPMKDEGGG